MLIDVDPFASGIQLCESVPVGATFDAEIVVRNVTDLMGFNFNVWLLDPGVATEVGLDVNMFLASAPGASFIDLSDPLPDSDSYYLVAAVEAGEGPLMVDEVVLSDSSGNAIDVSSILPTLVYLGEPCP